MKTLIYLLPAYDKHKCGAYEDYKIYDDVLRVIYYDENMGALRFGVFKYSVRKLLRGGVLFGCDTAERIHGEIFYRNGQDIALKYIKQILFSVTQGENKDSIVIFSKNISDMHYFKDTVMSCNVKILTIPSLVALYDDYMYEEFGMANAAAAALQLEGKTVVIMPECYDFSAKGAENIINFSGKEIDMPCITPRSICFSPPHCFKAAGNLLRRADRLQTALDFFGINYDNLSVFSVKIDK